MTPSDFNPPRSMNTPIRSTVRCDSNYSMTPSALAPSLPDIDSPLRTSLDPVGTPRRSGSSSSCANPWNTDSRAGSVRTFSGSRIVTDSDLHVASLWARYAQIQATEGTKNELLEEVLTRYTYLQQTHNELLATTEQELISKVASVELENSKADVARLVDMLQVDPFALVLIDGDGMYFDDHLVRHGEEGGRQAAAQLNKAVTDWMRGNLDAYSSDCQIVTRVYANVKDMADNCFLAGVVSSPDVVEEFVRGFMRSGDLFDFIDVSFGNDSPMTKINAMLKLHIRGYQCRHILIGCAETEGYAHMLDRYSSDRAALQDMTLLGAKAFEHKLAHLPMRKITLPPLFRKSHTGSEAKGDPTRERHDSKTNFNPTSGVFTPSSRTPVPVVLLPDGRKVGGRAVSPAVSSARGNIRSSSSASSSAISDAAPRSSTVKKAVPVAPNAWSSIAQRSAHLPFKDLTRPAPEPKLSGPLIRQNKYEQRLDQHMDYDHDRVYELKKLKLCNQHYIGRGCCHWEAGNGACPHKHDYPLSAKDKNWLRVVARETVCKKGTYCLDFECIYGHHCPYPKANEGSMRGIGCINGDACRFGREMHGMDMTVANVLQPKDLEYD
ncbi:unnamed protein product [Zymoseptoria tritici ST99CH_1A5]|uniref:C3H1-type domain-containing protein n=1 Tax=Zymoseptoria tritici ST99CH_1A5 TaxID=1276529 RepID=A0A1Y6LCU3_ZYMTR|nr:unnamed protein product [Zymoseptoria tritici ST99CH_1A5]